ncbi:unnamed protein product [Brassica oleracea var. botrytis]
MVFDGNSGSPIGTLTNAIVAAREWDIRVLKEKGSSRKSSNPPVTSSGDSIVVRTDAAWRSEDRSASLGWTLQADGQSVEFKKFTPTVSSPLAAEGLAMREALIMCKEIELQHVRVECDSSQLVQTSKGAVKFSELHRILSDLKLISSSFNSITFVWIPRDLNVLADKLAKDALYVGDAFMVPT